MVRENSMPVSCWWERLLMVEICSCACEKFFAADHLLYSAALHGNISSRQEVLMFCVWRINFSSRQQVLLTDPRSEKTGLRLAGSSSLLAASRTQSESTCEWANISASNHCLVGRILSKCYGNSIIFWIRGIFLMQSGGQGIEVECGCVCFLWSEPDLKYRVCEGCSRKPHHRSTFQHYFPASLSVTHSKIRVCKTFLHTSSTNLTFEPLSNT